MLTHLKSLIANDQVEDVIDYLLQLKLKDDFNDEIVLISGRMQRLKKELRAGTIDMNTAELRRNQIKEALLPLSKEIIKELGTQKLTEVNLPPISSPHHPKLALGSKKLVTSLLGLILISIVGLSIFWFGPSISNNNRCCLKGYVFDGKGHPLKDAEISMETHHTKTDERGFFELKIPSKDQQDRYDIVVLKKGFQTVTQWAYPDGTSMEITLTEE